MRKIFIIIIVIIGILLAIIGYNYSIAKTEKIALQDTLAQIEETNEEIIDEGKNEEQQNVVIVEERDIE